jgi:hypothetical protein
MVQDQAMSSSGPRTPIAKSVWTEADFESVGWHDNAVHAFAFEPASPYPGRLLVDLDHIIEWVSPVPPETRFSLLDVPVHAGVRPRLGPHGRRRSHRRSFTLQLNTILRSEPDPRGFHEWTLEGHDFTLRLSATGFTQYLRRPPIRSFQQRLETDEHGGLSFDQLGYTP